MLTSYNLNTQVVGEEYGFTGLWGAGALTCPSQVDCNFAAVFDSSTITSALTAGSPSTIMGYPCFNWGNAMTWNNVPLTPQQVSSLSSNWHHAAWSLVGAGDCNVLVETHLTDVAISSAGGDVKKIEIGVLLHMPELTKQYIFNSAHYQNLGGYVDPYGRAWTAVFKPHDGDSVLGYCLIFPSDMEDRTDTQFDKVAFFNWVIPQIVGASTAWYHNGSQFGIEPYGSSGTLTFGRIKWDRGFNNSPYTAPASVKENIMPNSRLLSAYGWSTPLGGFSIPGDGTVTINNSGQWNTLWIPVPMKNGIAYNVSFDIVSLTSGSARLDLANNGSNVVSGTAHSAVGSYSQAMTAAATTNAIRITTTGAANTLKIANIKVVPA